MYYDVTGGRHVHHALLMDWQPYGPRQSVPLRANFGHLLLDAAVRHLVFSRVQAPSQRDSVTDLSVVWAEFERPVVHPFLHEMAEDVVQVCGDHRLAHQNQLRYDERRSLAGLAP